MTDIYKQVHQLPELCSIVFGSLCEWDIERQTQFSLYCYHLFSLVDTPAPVVYTSLKYVQTMLAKGTEMDEYSLFTVALVLSYKYTEDYAPPFMLQWSCASMIPVKTLTTLELNSLSLLDYSLYISADAFRQWTEECNVLYDLTATDSLFTKSLSSTPYTSPPLTPVYFWDNTTAPPFYLDDLVVMSQSMISEPNFVCNPEFLDCDCIIHPEYHPPTLECTSTSWMCQDDSMWYNLF